jgi:hypothetical protein
MAQYELKPEHTYNMDERCFAIGLAGKSTMIFDKVLYGRKQYKQPSRPSKEACNTSIASSSCCPI